jgi:hypothetical protein
MAGAQNPEACASLFTGIVWGLASGTGKGKKYSTDREGYQPIFPPGTPYGPIIPPKGPKQVWWSGPRLNMK